MTLELCLFSNAAPVRTKWTTRELREDGNWHRNWSTMAIGHAGSQLWVARAEPSQSSSFIVINADSRVNGVAVPLCAGVRRAVTRTGRVRARCLAAQPDSEQDVKKKLDSSNRSDCRREGSNECSARGTTSFIAVISVGNRHIGHEDGRWRELWVRSYRWVLARRIPCLRSDSHFVARIVWASVRRARARTHRLARGCRALY